MALTPKEARFIDEYLIDLNGAAAARRAGYAVRYAREIACQNLTKLHIKEEIDRRRAEYAEACKVNAEALIRELTLVAHSDMGEVLDFNAPGGWIRLRPGKSISPEVRRCIAQIRVKRQVEGRGARAREVEVTEFRLWPKLEAIVTLAKMGGLIKDRKEITGKDGAPLSGFDVDAAIAALLKAKREQRDGGNPGPGGDAGGA